MAYQFKLEAVLNYRRNLEELAQQRLAKELNILEGHINWLASLEVQLQEMIDSLEERKKKPMLSPLYALFRQSIDNKEREIKVQGNMIASQRKVVEQARVTLAEKVKKRKVMEKARERDYDKYQLEVLKKEQNESDEQMVLRFGRQGTASL